MNDLEVQISSLYLVAGFLVAALKGAENSDQGKSLLIGWATVLLWPFALLRVMIRTISKDVHCKSATNGDEGSTAA